MRACVKGWEDGNKFRSIFGVSPKHCAGPCAELQKDVIKRKAFYFPVFLCVGILKSLVRKSLYHMPVF